MTDGDRPLNNDWVLGPDEPVMDIWEAAFSWGRGMEPYRGNVRARMPGTVRSSNTGTERGNVRTVFPGRTPRPRCAFCGAPTKQIGRRLFCRDCGYFESCCDGGKEAVEGEC